MGSEGRSKKRRASGSEEEGRSKRHRSRDEKDRKSRKSEKEKKKSKKSHKHSKSSDKGVKSSKKQDREYSKGASHSEFEEISEDDYFSKNNEFSTWLKEERRQFFSDLSSEEAHILFSSFIKEWNGRKLQPRYYEGIATGPRTSHNWKIAHGK